MTKGVSARVDPAQAVASPPLLIHGGRAVPRSTARLSIPGLMERFNEREKDLRKDIKSLRGGEWAPLREELRADANAWKRVVHGLAAWRQDHRDPVSGALPDVMTLTDYWEVSEGAEFMLPGEVWTAEEVKGKK
jgi:hypothetical protein